MILFRADASLQIGTGHVMRCRTLARELKRQGSAVVFLCRPQPGDLIGMLSEEFDVLVLVSQAQDRIEMEADFITPQRRKNDHWLGASQVQDARDCMDALAKRGLQSIDWMVVDHYGLDDIWERTMLASIGVFGSSPRLLVIDDLADRRHAADILLDQNRSGPMAVGRYAGLLPDYCRLLLGPQHALLTPEYALWQDFMPQRVHLARILIFFGGGDTCELAAATIEALNRPDCSDLFLDVVHNHQADPQQLVNQAAARRPRTSVHNPLPSLAGLIARADLAIGAAGSTTWERACLGLPSLLLVLDHNQSMVAEEAEERGAALCLGQQLNGERMAQCIRQQVPLVLQQMSQACVELCDGQGVSRMIRAMSIEG